MKTKCWTNALPRIVASLLLIALSGALHAEDHHDGGKKDGKEEAVPDTYSKAIAEIEEHRDNIAKLIETGKLDGLHKEGEVIKKIAQSLAKLASKEDSGVAKSDIKEVNVTAKALAATYEPLDEAGDAGKKEESKKVYDEIVKHTATLKKFAKAGK